MIGMEPVDIGAMNPPALYGAPSPTQAKALAAGQFSPADGKYSPAPPAANILNSLMGNYGKTGTHDKPGSDENGVTIERTAGSIVATPDPLPRQASSAQKKEPPGVSFSACIDGTELSGQITGKFNARNINPAMVSMAAQTALESLGKSPADRFSLADWDRMKRQMETSLGTPIEDIRGIALQGLRCN